MKKVPKLSLANYLRKKTPSHIGLTQRGLNLTLDAIQYFYQDHTLFGPTNDILDLTAWFEIRKRPSGVRNVTA